MIFRENHVIHTETEITIKIMIIIINKQTITLQLYAYVSQEMNPARAILTEETSCQPSTSKSNSMPLMRRVKSDLSDASPIQVGNAEFVGPSDASANKNPVTESIGTVSIRRFD